MKIFILGILAVSTIYGGLSEEMDAFIQNAQKEYEVPGVAVVIIKDNEILLEKGFGVVEIGKPAKVDANTIFQLASVSKTFAAAGLGVKVGEGVISWDQPIYQALPEFVFSDPYIRRWTTARDLLSHRTSLPAFQGDLLGDLGYTREEVLERVQFIKSPVSFREKALYSNVNFLIAGQLLSKLTDQSWEDSIRKSLLNPLEMTRTGFEEKLKDPNAARSHAKVNGKIEPIRYSDSSVFAAAGGVTSTAHDLGNWMKMHLNKGVYKGKQILKSEVVQELFSPSMVSEVGISELYPITDTSSFAYGMGWGNFQYQGAYIVEKGGALGGIRTLVTLIPEKNIGIAILANLNFTVLPELVRAKMLSLLLDPKTPFPDALFKENEKTLAKLLEPEAAPKAPLPFGRSMKMCEGLFESDLYGKVEVKEEGGKLILKAGPIGYKGTLKHLSNDSFNLSWPQINQGSQVVTFMFGPDGKAVEITTETMGNFSSTVNQKF